MKIQEMTLNQTLHAIGMTTESATDGKKSIIMNGRTVATLNANDAWRWLRTVTEIARALDYIRREFIWDDNRDGISRFEWLEAFSSISEHGHELSFCSEGFSNGSDFRRSELWETAVEQASQLTDYQWQELGMKEVAR